MCGIAGIFNYAEPGRPIERSLLERMTRALAHRGPDGEGFYVEGPIGFGHRRLAIVELSEAGAQPMLLRGDALTFNGEIYNHAELRRALPGPFRGHCDSETLLHLLSARGDGALEALSGIFAFAFWNEREHTLLLARDQLGVKQLYYYDDGRRLLFASEMKALLHCASMPRELDAEALNQYLHFHSPVGERTFVRAIRQLRPGECLRVDRGGRRSRLYFRLDRFGGGPSGDEAVRELRGHLLQAVSDQLMSDVPVGAFFSGGIDSSAVAAYASRAGQRPRCFGVHFSGSSVIDERPFQEAAARALGLELALTTYDARRFPDDLGKLAFQQDQPVIGPAMFPMYEVSRLAAANVKVCLGGQGADEIFGGYARYALAQPMQMARSLAGSAGNLLADLREPRTWRRLASAAGRMGDWRETYFSHMAQVPEGDWRALIDDALVSRQSCNALFRDTVDASPARDPADKVMHWDALAYLPGLFQQDDRMSMAHGLESRVPLADARLVRFAFGLSFRDKFRAGSSKWALRQAVSDVLPAEVLNRRKVGFDTPAEDWMRNAHRGFVRETLLSARARGRGFWKPAAVERLLDSDREPLWFARLWKLLCVEAWALSFLDQPLPRVEPATPPPAPPLRTLVQELREMGPRTAAFRARWELENVSGLRAVADKLQRDGIEPGQLAPLPLPPAGAARAAVLPLLDADALAALQSQALQAARGTILGFGWLPLDCGDPIDWHRDPLTGRHWPAHRHWSRALSLRGADVKAAWEPARFPHFYAMARAAVLLPAQRDGLCEAMAAQIRSFVDANPWPLGIHWASGQEIALRTVAWGFVWSLLRDEPAMQQVAPVLARAVAQGAAHIERNYEFVERVVANNHLISEAVGLLAAATMLPADPRAAGWRSRSLATLTAQSKRQFYDDGAYIQCSHNYQRTATDALVMACVIAGTPPPEWTQAIARSVRFLAAHQNPRDGRLPNSGANDGSMFAPLSSCEFSDFRPSLQMAAAALGERLYPAGPWDEPAAWLFGAGPRNYVPPPLRSASFPSGWHVLRAADTFATLRCGPVRERYGQADMLHVDLFWRGHEIAADGGSYSYADDRMHRALAGTASHNTVAVDGRDQMVRQRRFATVYRTPARLLRFEPGLMAGEHSGYARWPGGAVHRREVRLGAQCTVIDRVSGEGEHELSLQWLCGPWPAALRDGGVVLETPDGPFSLAVFDARGQLLQPGLRQGWISRRYLERVAAPSLLVTRRCALPATFVTVMGPGLPGELRFSLDGPP